MVPAVKALHALSFTPTLATLIAKTVRCRQASRTEHGEKRMCVDYAARFCTARAGDPAMFVGQGPRAHAGSDSWLPQSAGEHFQCFVLSRARGYAVPSNAVNARTGWFLRAPAFVQLERHAAATLFHLSLLEVSTSCTFYDAAVKTHFSRAFDSRIRVHCSARTSPRASCIWQRSNFR